MPLDPTQLEACRELALRCERLFLAAQYEAATREEVDRALLGRRHAVGLRKVLDTWPAPPAETVRSRS